MQDYICRTERRKSRSHKQLRTIGQKSLHKAGDSIHQRGTLSRRYGVTSRQIAGYRSYRKNCNGIVRCAEVCNRREQRNNSLRTTTRRYILCQTLNKIVKAAHLTNYRHHTSGKQRNEYQLAHRVKTLSRRSKERQQLQLSTCKRHNIGK